MLAVALACAALATVHWPPPFARRAALGVIVLAVPVAFVLGFAGVGFGHGDVSLWQAMGASVPLVLTLVLSRRRLAFALGLLALTISAVVSALALAGNSSPAAVVIGALVPLAVGVGWFVFYEGIARIGRRAAAHEREARRLTRETAADRATEASGARWRSAGLESVLAVLGSLADGSAHPSDPGIRHVCGREESHLRQLLLISADSTHLGAAFAATLREARECEVELNLHSGDVDVDAETAAALQRVLVRIVRAAGAGSAIIVGSFLYEDRPVVTVVGPTAQMPIAEAEAETTGLWRLRHEDFPTERILEFTPGDASSVDVRPRTEETGVREG